MLQIDVYFVVLIYQGRPKPARQLKNLSKCNLKALDNFKFTLFN